MFKGYTAGVILAVTDDHENSSDGFRFRKASEFVSSEGNGIPKGCAAGGHQFADGVGEELLVGGEILNKQNRVGNSDDESEITLADYDLLQKVAGRVLLEFEAVSDGGTGVDDDAKAQR